jgi:hypothetical protein
MTETQPYETRTISIVVLPTGAEIFSERATTVSICDDAGGEFVEIEQPASLQPGKIKLDPEEWPMLRAAIDRMIEECRS